MPDDIGLTRGTVRIVDYLPVWVQRFEEENTCLLRIIGSHVLAIEHIGSTSVPGLAAKPIIDMVAAVDRLAIYRKLVEPLTSIGYEYMPERVFEDRVFFPKGPSDKRTHHLSLVLNGSAAWVLPMRFRDYLVAHPKVRDEYQAVKRSLAVEFAVDRASYTAAKADIIQKILNMAEHAECCQVAAKQI